MLTRNTTMHLQLENIPPNTRLAVVDITLDPAAREAGLPIKEVGSLLRLFRFFRPQFINIPKININAILPNLQFLSLSSVVIQIPFLLGLIHMLQHV